MVNKLYHVVAGHWNKLYASCLFLTAGVTKNEGPMPILKPSESHPLLHLQIKPSGANYLLHVHWKCSFSETAGL